MLNQITQINKFNTLQKLYDIQNNFQIPKPNLILTLIPYQRY